MHRAGDVDQLTEHLALLDADRNLLQKLREASLRTADEITWRAAGRKLLAAYEQTIVEYRQSAGVSHNELPVAAHS